MESLGTRPDRDGHSPFSGIKKSTVVVGVNKGHLTDSVRGFQAYFDGTPDSEIVGGNRNCRRMLIKRNSEKLNHLVVFGESPSSSFLFLKWHLW
jgi:hypothetical protein